VIVFEPGCQSKPLELAEGAYLCGSGGWGDDTAGSADAAGMALNDENLIAELRTGNLTAQLRSLGKNAGSPQSAHIPADPANPNFC
jgi:hypothetical protein